MMKIRQKLSLTEWVDISPFWRFGTFHTEAGEGKMYTLIKIAIIFGGGRRHACSNSISIALQYQIMGVPPYLYKHNIR